LIRIKKAEWTRINGWRIRRLSPQEIARFCAAIEAARSRKIRSQPNRLALMLEIAYTTEHQKEPVMGYPDKPKKSPFSPVAPQRPKVELTDTIDELRIKMAEGNLGALSVIERLLIVTQRRGIRLLLDFDDMGMRGAQIWAAYQYFAKADLPTLIKALEDRDPAMVALVNKECPNLPRAGTDRFSRGAGRNE
jgi:hypothetical protein